MTDTVLLSRQRDVVIALSRGMTVSEAGYHLGISNQTAKKDVMAAKDRLGYRGTATGLVLLCIRRGLIPMPEEAS